MAITLHHGDIPADIDFGDVVAVDAEMMGLNPMRDRLCLVQLSSGDGNAHLVKFSKDDSFAAPNLKNLLADPDVVKIFHFARKDIAVLWTYLEVMTAPVFCTKIASRLTRTFTDHHSLKTICKDMLNVELSKQQQSTDWGADELTKEQLEYAASDVYHLHKLKDLFDAMLAREGRVDLAHACFDFLPVRAMLDAAGWEEEDIFAH